MRLVLVCFEIPTASCGIDALAYSHNATTCRHSIRSWATPHSFRLPTVRRESLDFGCNLKIAISRSVKIGSHENFSSIALGIFPCWCNRRRISDSFSARCNS